MNLYHCIHQLYHVGGKSMVTRILKLEIYRAAILNIRKFK